MIGTANGVAASITGLGCRVPERVVTNDDLSAMMDTSDEWIRERTGIRERRIAGPDEALSDLCLPAAKEALEDAGVKASEIDLLIVATVTPDMVFPATAAILADELGAENAGAYDLSAGCTGFMYALAQAYGMLAGGLAKKALVVGGDVLSKIMDWSDRRTCVLFGDGAGAVVLELVDGGGFLGFELGADGSGGPQLYLPGGRLAAARERRVGRRAPALRADERPRGVQVRDARARLVRRGRCWPNAAALSTTWTSTCRTRRTSGSSSTRARSSAFRRRGWWSTSTATGTRRRARFRSRWPMRGRMGGSRRESWC